MGRRGGGGANGGANGASNARELRLFLSHRMWREHRYVLAGVAALAAALFASALVQSAGSSERMHRLDASALMGRVLASGEPWAVLCLRPDDAVPEAVDELPKRLRGRVRVGVLDCAQPWDATGRSVLDALGIRPQVRPTVFTVANGDAPKQVSLGDLQSARTLAKRVLKQTKKAVVQVRSSRQLSDRCLARDACVLLLRGRRLEPFETRWLQALAHKHRAVAFVWADAKELKLSIEAGMPVVAEGEHRLALFRRADGADGADELTVRAFRGIVFDAVAVGLFLDENLADGAKLKPLARTPTLKKRRTTAGRPRRRARPGGDGRGQEAEAEDGTGGDEAEEGTNENAEGPDGDESEDEHVLDLDDE